MTRNPANLLLVTALFAAGALAALTPTAALAAKHSKGKASKASKSSTSSSSTSPTELESIPPSPSPAIAPAPTTPPSATTTSIAPSVVPVATAKEPASPSPPAAERSGLVTAADSSAAAGSAWPAPAATGPTGAPAPSSTVVPAVDDESATGHEAAAANQPISFVEHLGAQAYPDHKRGLYGGSLWLEPSFHGLQWPYMPRTGLGISGSAWIDNGYETIDRGLIGTPNSKLYVQQGRAVLRATPTYARGDFFVQGQMELVGNKDQVRDQASNSGIVDIDDLWLRVGEWNRWDLKVGRFEGWEVYHTGMGLDINTIERRGAVQGTSSENIERPDYYGLTFLHDRPSAQGVGNIAVHVYPLPIFRVELLGQIGADAVSDLGSNYVGGRAVGILDLGFLKAKGGAEWVKATPAQTTTMSVTDAMGNPTQVKEFTKTSQTQLGYSGALQLVIDPLIELGANLGIAITDATGDKGDALPAASNTTYSIGGFANVAVGHYLPPLMRDLLVGAGVNWTTRRDLQNTNGKVDYTANLQTFGAVQYIVARQLFVKLVLAYARSDFDLSLDNNQWSNYMWSGRVRMMYLF